MTSQVAPVSLAVLQHPVRPELDRVSDELARIVRSDFPLIGDANAHLLQMRGKLFRPTLLLLAAQAVDRLDQGKVTLAATVELIHVATLVHDDSVDHSALRRGQPTINARFSHQIAVIMGDYLYSRAIIELVRLGDLDPLRVMSRVTNEMTVGEMRELDAHDVLDYPEESYDALIMAKTASLMSGACEVGAHDGDQGDRDALRRYGLHLGMAFQITDDLLDYTETESVTGKPTGLDLREHKITLPLILALPQMSPEERATVERLMSDLRPPDSLINTVIATVEARGGIAAARARAAEFAARAHVELQALPAGGAREALADCITYSIERRS